MLDTVIFTPLTLSQMPFIMSMIKKYNVAIVISGINNISTAVGWLLSFTSTISKPFHVYGGAVGDSIFSVPTETDSIEVEYPFVENPLHQINFNAKNIYILHGSDAIFHGPSYHSMLQNAESVYVDAEVNKSLQSYPQLKNSIKMLIPMGYVTVSVTDASILSSLDPLTDTVDISVPTLKYMGGGTDILKSWMKDMKL